MRGVAFIDDVGDKLTNYKSADSRAHDSGPVEAILNLLVLYVS